MNYKGKDEIILALCGLAAVGAGVLNGFIGTGGGVIMLLILRKLCKDSEEQAFASVTAAVLPMTLMSALIYGSSVPGLFASAAPFYPAAVSGGVCGALFLKKAGVKAVRAIFASLLLISGVITLVK